MHRWELTLTCLSLAVMGTLGCAGANPSIEPRADAALRRMGDTLAGAKSFKVHIVATIEERLESGQMAQFSRDSLVVLSRPDGLQADVRRGPEFHRIWHKGKELTILDDRKAVYSVIQTPEPVGEMLDFLAEKHDIVVPSDDLLFPNPYQVLTEHVTSGVFVDQQEIDGRKCDHLLFTQDEVDWQIWIDAGSPAVPRKVVITYKTDPDNPQYEAVLDQWQLDLPDDPSRFKPQIPAAARRVDIEDLMESD